ncbi:MAG: hypothetical protein JSW58_08665 [Candidatus Latescibacterota bacterium]|nr:MAG: hypothetical protein JSW58_08665 [Candidatus Latescibacterota bacterium]
MGNVQTHGRFESLCSSPSLITHNSLYSDPASAGRLLSLPGGLEIRLFLDPEMPASVLRLVSDNGELVVYNLGEDSLPRRSVLFPQEPSGSAGEP